MSRDEYNHYLEELKQKEGVTDEEIEEFKKAAIIKKSVDEIRKRYQDLEQIRKSPDRYNNVKSKVSRCLKVQNKVAKKRKSNSPMKRSKQKLDDHNTSNLKERNSHLNVSQYGMSYSTTPLK